MRFFKNVRKYGVGATLAAAAGTAAATPPDMLTEAQTALDAAKADGLTMGGYVVSVVVGLLVIGIIIGIARKTR